MKIKTRTLSLAGAFCLFLLIGCTSYEIEPTFGKVPDIVCQCRKEMHQLLNFNTLLGYRHNSAAYACKIAV